MFSTRGGRVQTSRAGSDRSAGSRSASRAATRSANGSAFSGSTSRYSPGSISSSSLTARRAVGEAHHVDPAVVERARRAPARPRPSRPGASSADSSRSGTGREAPPNCSCTRISSPAGSLSTCETARPSSTKTEVSPSVRTDSTSGCTTHGPGAVVQLRVVVDLGPEPRVGRVVDDQYAAPAGADARLDHGRAELGHRRPRARPASSRSRVGTTRQVAEAGEIGLVDVPGEDVGAVQLRGRPRRPAAPRPRTRRAGRCSPRSSGPPPGRRPPSRRPGRPRPPSGRRCPASARARVEDRRARLAVGPVGEVTRRHARHSGTLGTRPRSTGPFSCCRGPPGGSAGSRGCGGSSGWAIASQQERDHLAAPSRSGDWCTVVSGGCVDWRERRVVEADHRHVAGHPPAGLLQHPQRAGRHQVVGAEDAVDVGAPVQQVAHRRARRSSWLKSPCTTSGSSTSRPAGGQRRRGSPS